MTMLLNSFVFGGGGPAEPIKAYNAALYSVEQKFGLADVGARDAAIYVVDFFTSPDHQLSTEAWVYVIES